MEKERALDDPSLAAGIKRPRTEINRPLAFRLKELFNHVNGHFAGHGFFMPRKDGRMEYVVFFSVLEEGASQPDILISEDGLSTAWKIRPKMWMIQTSDPQVISKLRKSNAANPAGAGCNVLIRIFICEKRALRLAGIKIPKNKKLVESGLKAIERLKLKKEILS